MTKLFLFLAIFQLVLACNGSYTAKSTMVKNTTLLIAADGSIFNYNFDENKIKWIYNSSIDSGANRNYFALDGQNIFLPFESGKFINFDVETGKIIWEKQIDGNEDEITDMASGEYGKADYLQLRMPLFMTRPLVDEKNIVIASTGQPMLTKPWLYCIKKATGMENWHSPMPTPYNFFAPVKYRGFYFVNSAAFLEKIDVEEGGAYSYGMYFGSPQIAGEEFKEFEENQFEFPVYSQMQTDGENLFIGDEKGNYFCFNLDKTATLQNGDETNPNNTFVKNPNVFKWKFRDDNFDFQSNTITFLEDEKLFVEMKNGIATKSCFYAINTENGKPKWKKIVNGNVLNWSLNKSTIVGNTPNTIFYMDTNGENFIETKILRKPLSNIEWKDDSHLIYVTQKGIEVFNTKSKKAKLIFEKAVIDKQENNFVQIKYIPK